MTGKQIIIRRRSAEARLARKVFVGDLKEDFFMTVRMIRMLPETPRQKVILEQVDILYIIADYRELENNLL